MQRERARAGEAERAADEGNSQHAPTTATIFLKSEGAPDVPARDDGQARDELRDHGRALRAILVTAPWPRGVTGDVTP